MDDAGEDDEVDCAPAGGETEGDGDDGGGELDGGIAPGEELVDPEGAGVEGIDEPAGAIAEVPDEGLAEDPVAPPPPQDAQSSAPRMTMSDRIAAPPLHASPSAAGCSSP